MKKLLIFLLVLTAAGVGIWFKFLSPVSTQARAQIISSPNTISFSDMANKAAGAGLVRSGVALKLILWAHGHDTNFAAGGYELAPNMTAFQTADALISGPQLIWVEIVPGLRKEQMAEKLQAKFSSWTAQDVADFESFPEGQYFPDTYLIPRNATGKEVGQRMVDHFNEVFAPYAAKFLAQNIKNDTAIKIASIIQREAAGNGDMPIIAGIIWNRLLKGMALQIDAEIQYAKGKVGNQWWSHVSPADLKIDSPYNSYLYKGLPPTPIANPGLPAIDAVLNSAQTDCLYYLHDSSGQIHCSPTYAGHLENIKKFLE
ncbi:MAG: endolytic transglycosylase MltG [Patescibacteria group bacterium]|nr:endolytic transglycosylase MltG [Patescibacteria group bacterium]